MTEGLLAAVDELRAHAAQCARLGAKDAARHLEAVAECLRMRAETEATNPVVVTLCQNCNRQRVGR